MVSAPPKRRYSWPVAGHSAFVLAARVWSRLALPAPAASPRWPAPGALTVRILLGLGLLLAAAVAPYPAAAQAAPDQLRGTVRDSSGRAVSGAEVVAVRAPDRAAFTTRTDLAGAFVLTIPDGTGDYLVHVSLPGWNAFRQRVSRSGPGPLPVLDVRLAPTVVNLAPLVASAQRLKPQRGQGTGAEPGAAEQPAAGISGAVSSGRAGDLGALAATVPGVMPTPEGIAVLGLVGQTRTRLNGLDFPGAEIPRDVRTRTRVATTSYDPARGGFGGAEVAVELAPGGTYTFRRAHLSAASPGLASAPGYIASRSDAGVQLSAGTDGALPGSFNYNLGLQLTRRPSAAASPAELRRQLVASGGASAEAVARLGGILHELGLPGLDAPRGTAPAQDVTFLGRLDHDPYGNRTWGVTLYAQRSDMDAPVPVGAAPSHGGRQRVWSGSLQGIHSFYFASDYLNETRSALSLQGAASTPSLTSPQGIVSLSSDADGPDTSASSFTFGGNPLLAGRSRSWTWETTNTTQWYTRGSRHRPKLYTQVRLDGYTRADGADPGTFTFPSLDALAANQPAAFTRAVPGEEVSGGEASAAVGIGDLWRVSPGLQLLYGMRVEGVRFTGRLPLNPWLLAVFGARSDHAPGGFSASPRLGFTWAYTGAARPAAEQRSVLGTRVRAPIGTVRGGIGEFRQLPAADLLAGAQANTGLSGGSERMRCVGGAVPIPDWEAFRHGGAAPPACGDSRGFSDLAPPVELFSGGYSAPHSWRGNLAWISRFRKVDFTLEGVYSLNLGQPGTLDLNFAAVPGFVLPAEGGRPVFVDPAAIVPATGAVSVAEARTSSLFGPVLERRSDLRSVSRQLTLTLTPDLNISHYFLSVAYTLGDVRAQARGFDASTGGDPRAREWAPGDWDVRHQVLLQAGFDVPDRFSFTLFGRFSSGLPYTPVVAGDVNGDGYANDRAFVFDPAADAATAALLRDAPDGAGDCLRRQVGRTAKRNSCRGPWTAALNARVQIAPPVPRTGRRATIALEVANPLGGLDRLVHGRGDLHGWGSQRSADPVLYSVRGFDPAERRFRYAVNPRFGMPLSGLGEPFRVSLDVSLDLSRALPVQQLERSLRGPGGKGRVSADSLLRRYARSVPDVYDAILQESDSLLLTPAQVAALSEARTAYRAKLDVVWRDLVDYLAALPEKYDGAEVLRRQESALDRAWEVSRLEGTVIKANLSALQLRLLPGSVSFLINSPGPVRIRTYMQ